MANEPIGRFGRFLTDGGIARQEELDALKADVDREIEDAVQAAMADPEPAPEDALNDLFVGQFSH